MYIVSLRLERASEPVADSWVLPQRNPDLLALGWKLRILHFKLPSQKILTQAIHGPH